MSKKLEDRNWKHEYELQKKRGDTDGQIERQRARRMYDKEGIDRAGKNIDHIKPLAKGASRSRQPQAALTKRQQSRQHTKEKVSMQIEALVASLHVHQHARVVCPSCSDERKKRDKDLVINRSGDAWVFFCHHCNTKGIVPVFKREKPMVQVQSINTNSFDFLQKEHYDFLSTRGISKETADAAQLFAAIKFFRKLDRTAKAVGLPYYKEGKVVGTKYRCIETKDFTQDAGGNNEFYGIDDIKEGPIVIVEGEIDALTLRECGIANVLSVPSGAPMKVSNGKIDASEDKKFEFVWNAFEILSKAPYVTIATDSDAAGQACAEELARRIGKDRMPPHLYSGKRPE